MVETERTSARRHLDWLEREAAKARIEAAGAPEGNYLHGRVAAVEAELEAARGRLRRLYEIGEDE